jgi:hypothetical protein
MNIRHSTQVLATLSLLLSACGKTTDNTLPITPTASSTSPTTTSSSGAMPMPTITADPTSLPMLRYEVSFADALNVDGIKRGGLTVGTMTNFGLTLLAIPSQKLPEAFKMEDPPIAINTYDFAVCVSGDSRIFEGSVYTLKAGVPMYVESVDTEINYAVGDAKDIGACYGMRVAGTWVWSVDRSIPATYFEAGKKWIAHIDIKTKNVDAIKLVYSRGVPATTTGRLVYTGRPM